METTVFDDPQRNLTLIMGGAAFGLVLCLWLLGVLFWVSRRAKRAREVEQRLNPAAFNSTDVSGGRVLRLWRDGQEVTTVVPGLASRGVTGLSKLRADAGWETPVSGVLLGLGGMIGLTATGAYLITSSLMATVLTPGAALLIFWIYLNQRIASRVALFERQFMDALSLAARSLRVGHPLAGAFKLISDEIGAPVGELFADVCQQQALGVPMEQALREVAARTASDDLKLFATSVVIQLRSGGNLADMMERLANVIRERHRLSRRVKVLTTQTQFSKRVLLALPFLVFALLNLINPQYMNPLYTTFTGQLIMATAATGLMLGWLMMNWLSKLDA